MRKPGDDFSLIDGEGYMVTDHPYQEHLSITAESKEVWIIISFYPQILIGPVKKSNCTNHRAVDQANVNRHNLHATGIGACACARHGCFIPHTVVDFQKGER